MYDVALLIERALTELDVQQVVSLHEGLDEQVTYHLLLPIDDAPAAMASSLGALGGADLASPVAAEDAVEIDAAVKEGGQAELDRSLELMSASGQRADGVVTGDDPVHALAELVRTTKAAEAIILTDPHVVSEFFHLDWTSRARRALDVPTLHLLEHETFDEQSSGGGEGATLI